MKIGRNFGGSWTADYFSPEEADRWRRDDAFRKSQSDIFRMRSQVDPVPFIRAASGGGLPHVELEETLPGVLTGLDPGRLFAIRETAKIYGCSLSLRLGGLSAEEFWREETAGDRAIEAARILGGGLLSVEPPTQAMSPSTESFFEKTHRKLQAGFRRSVEVSVECVLGETPSDFVEAIRQKKLPVRWAGTILHPLSTASAHDLEKGLPSLSHVRLGGIADQPNPRPFVSDGGWTRTNLEQALARFLAWGVRLCIFSGEPPLADWFQGRSRWATDQKFVSEAWQRAAALPGPSGAHVMKGKAR